MGQAAYTGIPEWDGVLEIVFSLRDGFVWASWPESQATVRLGSHEAVSAMMKDFLAQDVVARRLAGDLPPPS